MLTLDAARRLEDEETDFSLSMYGGLEFQPPEFQERFRVQLGGLKRVRYGGGYQRDELATLTAEADWVIVPSTWWENAPLVIEEALQHRRPVICSDIGGMAERVRAGVEGIHFRAGDAASLADALRRAATEEGLWDELVGRIEPVRTIAQSARDHALLYGKLLAPSLELVGPGGTPRRAA